MKSKLISNPSLIKAIIYAVLHGVLLYPRTKKAAAVLQKFRSGKTLGYRDVYKLTACLASLQVFVSFTRRDAEQHQKVLRDCLQKKQDEIKDDINPLDKPILSTRLRVPGDIAKFPNTFTLRSIHDQVKARNPDGVWDSVWAMIQNWIKYEGRS